MKQSLLVVLLFQLLFIHNEVLWAADVVSPPENAYLGSAFCQGCHQEQFATFSKTTMGRIFLNAPRSPTEAQGCEACHGPGTSHLIALGTGDENKGIIAFRQHSPQSVVERNAVCLGCHERGTRTFWRGSQHESRDLACTDCHKIMENISVKNQFVKDTEMEVCFQCHPQRRAQLQRSSHMPLREGKMTCSDCHNPHGTVTAKLLKANSVNETCYKCHAEKRGPFLWEHAPVRENCLICHDPHGSNHDKLLKVKRPRLCQRCHIGRSHPTEPQLPTSRFVFNRACQNCHSQIHGSNDPAGFRRQR